MNSIKLNEKLRFLPVLPENPYKTIEIPLFTGDIAAGFPSPAQDFIEKRIDLNQLLIKYPSTTYILKVLNKAMHEDYIHNGDIIVVNSSNKPKHEDIVIANIFGEFTIRKLCLTPKMILKSLNQNLDAITIANPSDLNILGVVTYIIHRI